MDCPRLTGEEAAELEARVLLTLRSVDPPPVAVTLVCDEYQAWVLWQTPDEHRIPVEEFDGIVEGSIDAIDMYLATGPRVKLSVAESQRELAHHESYELSPFDTSPVRDARRPRRRKEEAPRAGGFGISTTGEIFPEPDALVIGPRLDIALHIAHGFSAVTMESFRAAAGASPKFSLFDVQLGVAWGAPYSNQSVFGVVAMGGFEWLTLDEFVGDYTATWDVGVRLGGSVGPATLWFGTDYRYRAAALVIEPNVRSNRGSFVVSLGGFLTAPGRPQKKLTAANHPRP